MSSQIKSTNRTPPQESHLMDEADIGSGEKTPADAETQRQIEKIPPRGVDKPGVDKATKDGQHKQAGRGLSEESPAFPPKGN